MLGILPGGVSFVAGRFLTVHPPLQTLTGSESGRDAGHPRTLTPARREARIET